MTDFVAYTDESNWNKKRYRAIAMVTAPRDVACLLKNRITGEILPLLEAKGRSPELKWVNLKSHDYSQALISLLDLLFEHLGQFRVDALLWDVCDQRHAIVGRDDIANMHRMYFHLFRNVIEKRWEAGNWTLYVDQHSQMDWENVGSYLRRHKSERDCVPENGRFRTVLREQFVLRNIFPVDSRDYPLIQAADLMAGLAQFSWLSYEDYERWSRDRNTELSNKARYACIVLDYFKNKCEENKLYVSLKTNGGLYSFRPDKPLNFWLYRPQHEHDKAPTR